MIHKINYKISIVLLLAGLQTTFAQKKDENIGTEVVNVVKSYTPTVSDAFKIKETPTLDDEETAKKEVINYNIFSFPVASTFAPAKGRAASVDKTAQEKLYNNYATLGFGSYASINAELYITQDVNDTDFVAGMLRHQSSQGNIKGVKLDDKFYDTGLDLTYGSKKDTYNWNLDLGYQNQVYNWYGLPKYFGDNLSETDQKDLINSIDPQQTYHNFYIGGEIGTTDSFFEKASVKYNRFWDATGSEENHVIFKPSINLGVADYFFKLNFTVDYLNAKFDQPYSASPLVPASTFASENSNVILSANPNFQLVKDDLSVNVGAEVTYLSELKNTYNGVDEGTKGKLFIYPKVTASYKVVGDLMIAYAGAEGGLQQNTYRDFTNINPFLSPTQLPTHLMRPTDSQYDIYVGLKGKLTNAVSYNVRGSYLNQKNKALFLANEYSQDVDNQAYSYGNSFSVIYDDIKTISFFGELKADFSKNVAFGINGTFATYNTDLQPEAWNLPQLKLSSTLDVNFTEKWFAGVNVFFVGERMDLQIDQSFTEIGTRKRTLDAYFDANLNVGYRYNERLTAFVKANNIANQAYEKWLNYPVQQFQVLLGASYKFDF
ncbi:TonB-dependent receptor [Flavobacterium sp. SM2513]|uniref:TonB-dependent receptor n=1 Tax=Flavobacterium sp. SM2513 TaxID=3424766 RepID=UPI003D7F22D5